MIDELTESIVMPIKSLSLPSGVSRLAIIPVSGIIHLAGKIVQKRKPIEKPNK